MFCGLLYVQEEVVHFIYFKFDKINLDEMQVNAVLEFIKNRDITQFESVRIYGYTDDIDKENYTKST